MSFADWLAITGLVAGAVSVLLGVLAIWLALYIFKGSSRAETAVTAALEGIRAQTETLAKLSAQQIRGLTQIVRDQIALPDRQNVALLEVFRSVTSAPKEGFISAPSNSGGAVGEKISGHGIPLLPPDVDKAALREAAVTGAFAIYYYTSHANVLAQTYFPSEEEYDESNQTHRMLREILDLSASDFRAIAGMLDAWDKTESSFIRGHKFNAVFGMTGQALSGQVRNARECFDSHKHVASQP